MDELALVEGEDFYWEGAAVVFTEGYHLRRGHCCGSGCRHCPYGKGEGEPGHDEGETAGDEKAA